MVVDNLGFLFWFIVGGAIIDSIDPCIFTLYLSILLSISISSIRRIAAMSSVFISSVYVGYLTFNAILRFILRLTSPPRHILSSILIFYGLIILIQSLIFEKRNEDNVCKEDRILCKFVNKFDLKSKNLNILSVAFIGFIASFTILPCSAGMVIAFNIVTKDLGLLMWIPLAMLYTVIFVSPLIALALIVIGLTKIKKIYEIMLKNQKIIKVIGGLLMILIAIIISINLTPF